MARRTRTGLAGTAGEYHVVAELSKRGWLATITIKNAPGTDVLAQHVDTGTLIAIQTKTSTDSDSFILSVKDETPTEKTDAWYVLVRLRGLDQRPDFYVMPRNHVAAACFVGHRNWLSKPGRGGSERRDSAMRGIHQSEIQPYREQWDWLLQPTSSVPYQLPDWFVRQVGTFGLPDRHPDRHLVTAIPDAAPTHELDETHGALERARAGTAQTRGDDVASPEDV